MKTCASGGTAAASSGLIIAGLVVVAAVAAPLLVAQDPLRSDFAVGLQPPGTPGHPLGTDQLGRDLLARVLYGARVALFIGLCLRAA